MSEKLKYDNGLERWRRENEFRYKPDIYMHLQPVMIALAILAIVYIIIM